MDDIKRAPKIRASFCVVGRNWDPHECTEAIGIQPTKIWHQQRPALRKRRDLNTEEWVLVWEKQELYDTDEAVQGVLNMIYPARDRLRAFLQANGLRCTVVCTVFIRGDPTADRPVYELSSQTIERLATLGAGFVLEVYFD